MSMRLFLTSTNLFPKFFLKLIALVTSENSKMKLVRYFSGITLGLKLQLKMNKYNARRNNSERFNCFTQCVQYSTKKKKTEDPL